VVPETRPAPCAAHARAAARVAGPALKSTTTSPGARLDSRESLQISPGPRAPAGGVHSARSTRALIWKPLDSPAARATARPMRPAAPSRTIEITRAPTTVCLPAATTGGVRLMPDAVAGTSVIARAVAGLDRDQRQAQPVLDQAHRRQQVI
jgi:hypothetical protein